MERFTISSAGLKKDMVNFTACLSSSVILAQSSKSSFKAISWGNHVLRTAWLYRSYAHGYFIGWRFTSSGDALPRIIFVYLFFIFLLAAVARHVHGGIGGHVDFVYLTINHSFFIVRLGDGHLFSLG